MHNPHERRPDALAYDELSESPLSLPRLVRTLKSYGTVIVGITLGLAILYGIGATIYYLLAPVTRVARLPFRLTWDTANQGTYPNGTKFNIADVVSEPVIQQVFQVNKLDQYMSYRDFATSMFVEESNPELDRLAAEYRARLADPRLSTVDRDRLTTEYTNKMASVAKSVYALTYVCVDGACPPPTVTSKTLSDILTTWSRTAVNEKGVLLYRVPMLSPHMMSTLPITGDRLSSLLALRGRVNDLIQTTNLVRHIPGSELVRTRRDQLSHSDVSLRLVDLLRFRVEPLLEILVTSSPSPTARQQMLAQLQFDDIRLMQARARQRALTDALAAYERQSRPTTDAALDATRLAPPRKDGELTAQVGDDFLARIITLAEQGGGQEYRQKLVDEIKTAALDAVPMEANVAYDQRLLDQVGKGGAALPPEAIERQWNEIHSVAITSVNDLMEIYRTVSKQLYAETLYATAGPTSAVSERPISVKRLLMLGAILTAIMAGLATIGALFHARLRQDEATEAAMHEAEHEVVRL